MKKPLITLLKLLFVVALLMFLAKKNAISLGATAHAFTRWDLVGPAFGAYFLSSLLGVVRWHLLLRAQGIRIPLLRTLQLTFIGNFFNVTLPGAVTGDFVKAFYIGREVEGERARAFGSILFDRVAGLSALVVVSALALGFGFRDYYGTPFFNAIRIFMMVGGLTVILFYGYLFLVREHHDPLLRLMKALEKPVPRLGSITRVYLGLRHYHNHRRTVLGVLGISVVVQFLAGWVSLQFAYALGETQVHLLPIYIVVPLGLLVTAVPIAPAGIGTGNWAFSKLFGMIGSLRGGDVYSLLAISSFLVGAVGGVVYLQFRSHEPRPALPIS